MCRTLNNACNKIVTSPTDVQKSFKRDSPLSVCMQKDHIHTERSCSLCHSSVDYRNQTNQHVLPVSVFRVLKLKTIYRRREGDK